MTSNEMKIGANFDPISNINISMTEATGVERIIAIIGLINDLNEINLYANNANKKLYLLSKQKFNNSVYYDCYSIVAVLYVICFTAVFTYTRPLLLASLKLSY